MKNTYKLGLTLVALSATAATSFGGLVITVDGNRHDSFTTWVFTGGPDLSINDVQTFDITPDYYNSNEDSTLNSYSYALGDLSHQIGNIADVTMPVMTVDSGTFEVSKFGEPINNSLTLNGLRIKSDMSGEAFSWYTLGNMKNGAGIEVEFTSLTVTMPISITEFGTGANSLASENGTFSATTTVPTGNPGSFSMTFSAVPEPSSTALLGLGGLALLLRRRRA